MNSLFIHFFQNSYSLFIKYTHSFCFVFKCSNNYFAFDCIIFTVGNTDEGCSGIFVSIYLSILTDDLLSVFKILVFSRFSNLALLVF